MEVTFMAVAGEPDYFIFSPAGGAISGPHASALWAGPVPPIFEVSCFLVALFVSGFDHFIMWVVFSELPQSPTGHLNVSPIPTISFICLLFCSLLFFSWPSYLGSPGPRSLDWVSPAYLLHLTRWPYSHIWPFMAIWPIRVFFECALRVHCVVWWGICIWVEMMLFVVTLGWMVNSCRVGEHWQPRVNIVW